MATDVARRTADTKTRHFDWFDMPEFGRWLDFPDLGRLFDRTERFGHMMRIEEFMEGDRLVIRAEAPGIDPDKDVEITLGDGTLTISAERHEEETTTEGGRSMSEFHYGSFTRTVTVPKGVKVKDVVASYKDGILRVEVPMPEPMTPEMKKVPITRS